MSSLLHYQICSSYRPSAPLLFSLSITLHLCRKILNLRVRFMDNDNTNNRLTNRATVTIPITALRTVLLSQFHKFAVLCEGKHAS